MENSRQIEERAAEWLLRRENADWSDSEQRLFDQWLNASVLNRVAYLRLETGWEQVNRLKALGAGFPPRSVPEVAELGRAVDEALAWREPGKFSTGSNEAPGGQDARIGMVDIRDKPRRGNRSLISMVASVLLVVTGALVVFAGPWTGKRYATPVGGVSSVPLSDGSSVTLNTGSRIRVRMSDRERRVDLTQGEAFFDVAPDPVRPFVVQAGVRRIVVLGTKFSVRLDDDDVRIVVMEGKVGVWDSEGGSNEVSQLTAGAVVTATGDAIHEQTRTLRESEELLSWRFGYVVFDETTLADAVAEFKRYDERDIMIRDSQIAGIRLTGKFRANNVDAFVRLLESSAPVRAEYSKDRIVLTTASEVAR